MVSAWVSYHAGLSPAEYEALIWRLVEHLVRDEGGRLKSRLSNQHLVEKQKLNRHILCHTSAQSFP